jgi:predicted permease
MLKQEDGLLFSRLVIQVTLPALIFEALAHSSVEWRYLLLFVILFVSEMILLFIAWGFGRFMRLERGQMGSFLLVSAFGSSSLLGYALIAEVFPGDSAALAEAAFISELGVGFPLFTIGVMIAIYYGNAKQAEGALWSGAKKFFISPIFLSIIAGLLWSISPFGTDGTVVKPLFDALHIIAKANTFLVTLTVGVLLYFSSLRSILWVAFAAIMIKLILSPLLVYLPASMMTLEAWQLQVLILEAAMPSAMLSVVLATHYGCDAKLAARLVFFTLIASLLTTTAMIIIL